MRNPQAVLVALVTLGIVLSGCTGGTDTADADPATYTDADKFDSAVGSEGFQVSGGLAGSAAPIDAVSAAQLQIVDNVPSDAAGALDKATLILDARTTGLTVQATMRSMVRGQDLAAPYDFRGGVAQNVRLKESLGNEEDVIDAKAFMLVFGMARVSLNGQLQSSPVPVIAAATLGMRGPGGERLTSEDTHDLELHVFVASLAVPGEVLYFYFENVVMSKLSDVGRAGVGAGLVPFEPPNVAPRITARVLVGGVQTDRGVKEGNASLDVVLDASASMDSDGTIDAYSWEIFELGPNATYLPAAERRASGARADYKFNESGVKLVNLRIIDNDGAIATTNLSSFYVDAHRVSNFTSGTLQPGAAFVACQEAFNCNTHELQIAAGIQKADFKFTAKSSPPPTGVHMDLYGPTVDSCQADPGQTQTPIASSTDAPLSVEGTKLTAVGKYRLCVWYQAGASSPAWDIDITARYSPLAG